MLDDLPIHTIGHADHEMADFVELLRQHSITVVVDVRSRPYSRWVSQFNRELLGHDLEASGIGYHFMGDALGGRPSDAALYDPGQDRPDYARLVQRPAYRCGIERLLALAQTECIVVMCSEGEYRHCHRHLLLAQTLLQRGARVVHIRPDGTVVEGVQVAQQLTLL
jgi:uncharacterized protein (DUF488 family)